MRIYTRTGDTGLTGLIGGDRVRKDSVRITAIGEVDELNAVLGVARLHATNSELEPVLNTIQNLLFDLGAELASPSDGTYRYEALTEGHTTYLERLIDQQTQRLPPLKAFILPGGCALATYLHNARSVCRRAERSILRLNDEDPIRPEVLAFVNRLSDLLFTAARTANRLENVEDLPWQKTEDF